MILELQKYKNKVIEMSNCFIDYNNQRNFENSPCENEKCKSEIGKSIFFKFWPKANFLILILDKDKENENLNDDLQVKFEEKITLINKLSLNNQEYNFNLFAVIADRHNFVTLYKRNENNIWYRYDNENKMPIKDILKESIDFEHQLLLFYKKFKI